MKWRDVIVSVVLIAVVTGGIGMSCKQQPPPPPPKPNGGQPPQAPSPPTPSGRADLMLGQVRLEKSNDPGFNYRVIATIRNVGNGDATGFNAGCTYNCPPGEPMTSGGLDIVQGGYLRANSEFTYRQPFRYQCVVRPPMIDLDCVIEQKDGPPRRHMISVKLP